MTTEPRTNEPAGGDGLFLIIAATIIAVVTVEALFIAVHELVADGLRPRCS